MLVDLIGEQKLEALVRQARREIMVLHQGETVAAPVLDAARRGVRVRCVVPAGMRGDWPELVVRMAGTVPSSLYVFDRCTALVPAEEWVMLRDQGSVGLLCELFERVWSGALPAGWCGLTELQLTAIRLLADGHTDDAIAVRLGVSPRTVRRTVSELIERLGARGRFQAGAHAVRAGWLPVRPTTTPQRQFHCIPKNLVAAQGKPRLS